MKHRIAIPLVILSALALESALFGCLLAADLLRLRGERAFFRNDLPTAFAAYESALGLVGHNCYVESSLLGLFLRALGPIETDAKVKFPLERAPMLARAGDVAAELLAAAPYKSYYWSQASDLWFQAAWERDRWTTLDISSLSEDPVANLRAEERAGIAAMIVAHRAEPNNYLFSDLLVEKFLALGMTDYAARYGRLTAAALPDYDEHLFLSRDDLAPEIMEAALSGFDDALRAVGLVDPVSIECDAARLLLAHGYVERALPYLERAVTANPRSFLPRYLLGEAQFVMKRYAEAIVQFRAAAALSPDDAWPAYYLGMSYKYTGTPADALEWLQRAREVDGHDLRFFHALGETLEGLGRIKDAERQFVAAANLTPDSATAWVALLDFYARQRNVRAAANACAALGLLRRSQPVLEARCAAVEGGGQ